MTMKKSNTKTNKVATLSRHLDSAAQGETETERTPISTTTTTITNRHYSFINNSNISPQVNYPGSLESLQNSAEQNHATVRLRHDQHYHNSPGSATLISEESNQRKRERMGLFRNLRRKFSSFSIRKSEGAECNGHIGDIQFQNITANMTSSRLKERNLQPHDCESRSSSVSQSCDNLNSPLKLYMSPAKFNEWHSNTDHFDLEVPKDKPGCISKDISRFNPAASLQCDEYTQDDTISDVMDSYSKNNEEDNNSNSEPVYELADCVEYDPIKEQTKIWSPKVWSLTQELFRLSKFGWYWGPITRNEAEDKLTNQPDGAFLVRDSSDERYLLSLSFRSYGRTLHTRIEHCNGMFSFYAQPDTEGYPSIVDLIEHSMNDSQTGIFYYSRSRSPGAPQYPVRLKL